MKLNKDDQYVKIIILTSICAILVYTICSVLGYIPFWLSAIADFIKHVISLSSPVIVAFVIAYLLLIPTRAIENFLLERKHFVHKNKMLCRAIGVTISYICAIAIIAATVIGIYYMVGGQISKSTTLGNIYKTIASYFEDDTISVETLQEQLTKMDLPNMDIIGPKLSTLAASLSDIISSLISKLFGTIISIGGNLFNIIISIILSIYFIMSHEYFNKFVNKIFYVIFRKSRTGTRLRKCATIINETFSSYIRGQLIEAFIVAVLSSIVLVIIDVDYAIVIGIITGICNLVPYIGPLVGTVLAGIIGLLGGDIFTCIWAVVGMQVVQQLDANVICPRVVGNIVGLPGAFVIIAILIGGNYAGLLGMLIAVPVAASLKAIIGGWFDSRYPDFEMHYAGIMADADMRQSEKKALKEESKEQRRQKRRNILKK